MKRAGVTKPVNPVGIGHCGPIIVALANEEQKARYLGPMLRAEEMWCQLFSEPGAGSDLASLTTRAERDGDVYIVSGQKIWTSLAQVAKFGILIARTSTEGTKHTGISYFIVAMDSPGIEVRPIQSMTGPEAFGFNEVFFTDVRVPVENLIGEENLGWGMAKTTLANERVSLSTGGGLQWGYGPSARDLVVVLPRPRRPRRHRAAPAGHRCLHRRRDSPLPPHAHDQRGGQQDARPRRLTAQSARRPARPPRVHARQGLDGRARHARGERLARPRVGPRLPVLPRSRSVAARAKYCATSSQNACSDSRTIPTSRPRDNEHAPRRRTRCVKSVGAACQSWS